MHFYNKNQKARSDATGFAFYWIRSLKINTGIKSKCTPGMILINRT